jgi:hypothetical protein
VNELLPHTAYKTTLIFDPSTKVGAHLPLKGWRLRAGDALVDPDDNTVVRSERKSHILEAERSSPFVSLIKSNPISVRIAEVER